MRTKVSDVIASFFESKGVKHAFGIIGSANAAIFDSVTHGSNINLICNHHEQASTMAAQTYWKVSGTPTFALVTAGAGSSNAITGVLSAWADSIPCIIISGQEKAKDARPDNPLRMYGVQGFDSPAAVEKMTKYATRIVDPEDVLFELEKSWHLALADRPGPCWIDIPMDIQSSLVDETALRHYDPKDDGDPCIANDEQAIPAAVGRVLEGDRPLLWLGIGVRNSGIEPRSAQSFVEALGVPVLLSWSASDLLPFDHPLVVGSAGVYGQRAANFILQSCDALLTIGTRLAVPQIGYELSELARGATITAVDVDRTELEKSASRTEHQIQADAAAFVGAAMLAIPDGPARSEAQTEWREWCTAILSEFPRVGPEHDDKDGFINSYRFMEKLDSHLTPDQVVVTDMGTALLSAHQALELRPPQRLLTSQGLGEMGFGLPGAIGASAALGGGEVLCLNCDGGMMMNLQELQTISHNGFPIKIIVFSNDGYLMIKHTQNAILGGRYAGVDRASGVSCPDFSKVAEAFDMQSFTIKTWEDFDVVIPRLLECPGPAICEVFIHPEQMFHPKLGLKIQPDGSLISPPLEDLSPFLPRETLARSMRTGLHEKSRRIVPDEK
jgi:acetolactate synthase I/II/III large subunit